MGSFKERWNEAKAQQIAYTYETMKNTESMILSTTDEITGYKVNKYIGIVAGTDIYLVGGALGGGLGNQEELYSTALKNATDKLKQNAEMLGANGVVGIKTNVTSTGGTNFVILTLTGTAVEIQ